MLRLGILLLVHYCPPIGFLVLTNVTPTYPWTRAFQAIFNTITQPKATTKMQKEEY
jgi:hypothetical protein